MRRRRKAEGDIVSKIEGADFPRERKKFPEPPR